MCSSDLRAALDAARLVPIPGVRIAGNHGLELIVDGEVRLAGGVEEWLDDVRTAAEAVRPIADEAGGWVERRPDAKDRRINRIYLSRQSEQVLDELFPIAQATNNEAMGDLTAEERDVLTSLLGRMKSRLQAIADTTAAEETPADAETTSELVP